ncbi:hypothetical protein IPV09_06825 [Tessaracoccus sp. SD287]|uniref:hypothetical protein n=1 Tax=Tessaracoccus sp. SD287 TaxID=2782008 RepID=UPI001A96ED68|nr:hypothetical protein [Tessaracoccus sp. SD287]MBO1031048.1 hypothetical protein [Tessaracoccus sp. SD287]
MNRIVVTLVTLLSLFMIATVIIAVWQQSLGWGWWWVVPLGAGFVALVIVFRVLMQRADDRAQLLDAELDRLEQESA